MRAERGEKSFLFSNPTTGQGVAEITCYIESQGMFLPRPHGQHRADTF
jgi:hypothetical protein